MEELHVLKEQEECHIKNNTEEKLFEFFVEKPDEIPNKPSTEETAEPSTEETAEPSTEETAKQIEKFLINYSNRIAGMFYCCNKYGSPNDIRQLLITMSSFKSSGADYFIFANDIKYFYEETKISDYCLELVRTPNFIENARFLSKKQYEEYQKEKKQHDIFQHMLRSTIPGLILNNWDKISLGFASITHASYDSLVVSIMVSYLVSVYSKYTAKLSDILDKLVVDYIMRFVFTNRVDFENIVQCLEKDVYSNLESVELVKGEYRIIAIILWGIYKLEQKTITIDEIIDTIKSKTKNSEISVPIVACILGLITGFVSLGEF